MIKQAWTLTLRETQVFLTRPKVWLGIVAAGFLVGLSGPFNTYELMTLGPRLAYWMAVSILTFTSGSFFSQLAGNLLQETKVHIVIRIFAHGIAAIIPVVPIIFLLNMLSFTTVSFSLADSLETLVYAAAISVVISSVFAAFEYSAGQRKMGTIATEAQAGATEAQTGATAAKAVRILQRLDLPKRGELLSLSVQDHYVEVTTSKGASLILMRLADAIAETEGVEGLQIHRSHWVSLQAVKDIKRQGDRVFVVTQNDDELPISRTYMKAAKEAGLLAKGPKANGAT